GSFITQLESWFTNLKIIGVDASQVLLDYAASKTVRARYICAEAESVPLDDDSVDIVSLMQVIEHIEQPSMVFEEIFRVLKKQGLFILTTPNLSGLGSIIMKKKWQGYNDKTHISLDAYDNWLDKLKSANFDIITSGTTGLSGIPLARWFPINLLWQPWQIVFGFFPWKYGESITIIARKR
ncbi:MAG: class I SAM-dependent methyltransferase, partial [Sedimentisphaerales bacterium]|nr:class I SAM-dependent methyltransferase [Sedimentisphaerales bacterium]